VESVEKRGNVEGFVAAGSLDLPRKRKPGSGTGREVELVAVVPASLPRRDRRAVPPGGVRVRKALPLRAVTRYEPLTVGERRHVGGVNSYVLTDAGKLGLQGLGYAVETSAQERLVGPELDREAVAGRQARRIAQGSLQAWMLRDQGGYPRPGWEGEESFDKASADESAGSVTLAPSRVTRRVNLVDQRGDFRGVEEFANIPNGRATRYLAGCHRSSTLRWSRPRKLPLRGGIYLGFAGLILFGTSDVTALRRCG
jgi:hypothetical protein